MIGFSACEPGVLYLSARAGTVYQVGTDLERADWHFHGSRATPMTEKIYISPPKIRVGFVPSRDAPFPSSFQPITVTSYWRGCSTTRFSATPRPDTCRWLQAVLKKCGSPSLERPIGATCTAAANPTHPPPQALSPAQLAQLDVPGVAARKNRVDDGLFRVESYFKIHETSGLFVAREGADDAVHLALPTARGQWSYPFIPRILKPDL